MSDAEEVEHYAEVLRRFGGNINRAALELGMTRSKLRRLIERHRLDIERLRQG
jgi:DNA-binding NtrC family response regulator